MQAEGEHGKKAGTPCAWIAAKLWGKGSRVGLACGEAVWLPTAPRYTWPRPGGAEPPPILDCHYETDAGVGFFLLHDGNCCSRSHCEASASISRRKPARRDAAFGRARGAGSNSRPQRAGCHSRARGGRRGSGTPAEHAGTARRRRPLALLDPRRRRQEHQRLELSTPPDHLRIARSSCHYRAQL